MKKLYINFLFVVGLMVLFMSSIVVHEHIHWLQHTLNDECEFINITYYPQRVIDNILTLDIIVAAETKARCQESILDDEHYRYNLEAQAYVGQVLYFAVFAYLMARLLNRLEDKKEAIYYVD